jgi:small subunit ribosomal protein S1
MSNSNLPQLSSADAAERHPMFELLEAADGHKKLERGDVVSGTIAFIGEHELLIDVGAKFEGILAHREFSQLSAADLGGMTVGDGVECLVLNPEDRDGNLILSLSQARLGQDWDLAEKLTEDGNLIEVSVNGHNKGGLIAYIGEVRGFIPASQIDRRHAIDRAQIDGSQDSPLARLVGETIWAKVIEVDRRKNRLILSEQAAMRERRRQSKSDLLNNLEEGQVVQGIVTSLADFGAFVDIGGADGLVHLSELAWNRVGHPKELLRLGQQVTVKVISVDRERKRIGLSMKQLQPEPWSDLADHFQVGQVVSGTVTRLTDFGAFARLDGDIEGLIHVSELTDNGQAPADVVAPGDELALRVIRIDPQRKRIGLSLKRAGEEFDALTTPEALAALGAVLDETLDFDEADAASDAPAAE